jgi:predicted nicotinamide N-methyase/RimJ/RimL family protein N-acetyltransferase
MEDGGAVAQRKPSYEFKHEACGSITLEQHRGAAKGTHLVVWPPSVLMSRWMCAHPEVVKGKVVLELGAGLGLIGFVAARLGAKQVICTDIGEALDVLHQGIQINGLKNVTVEPLYWGNPEHIAHCRSLGIDLIIGADIVCNMDADTYEALSQTMYQLAQDRTAEVIVGYENRHGWYYDWVFMEKMTPLFTWTMDSLEQFADVPTDDDDLFRFRLLSSQEYCSNLRCYGWAVGNGSCLQHTRCVTDGELPLCSSARFDFYGPHSYRDAFVRELFNDKTIMLPFLPHLCSMTEQAMKERREKHRQESISGESCFLDIVDRATGEFVGVGGFRSTKNEVAEFGIVVAARWQRKGVCHETFCCNREYAKKLGFATITAATLELNHAMLHFLQKIGFSKTGSAIHDDREWIEFTLRSDQ